MIPIRSIAVSAVLLSEIEGELNILLMKRVKGGFWCHVVGKVEANETASQAVLREIGEETSIQVNQLFSADYIEQFYEASQNVIEMIPVFVGFCDKNQVVVLNGENIDYKWCNLTEAKALAVFSNQKKLYDFVWEHFVINEPEVLLEIK